MPDYSFIANPQTSNGLQSLSSIMNTAATAQQIQRGNVALQQERALLQPNIERGVAESELAKQTLAPKVSQAQSLAGTASEQQQQAHIATIKAQVANSAQQLGSLYGKGATPDQVRGILTGYMKNAGAKDDAIAQATADIPSDPTQVDQFIVKKLLTAIDASTQLDKMFPAVQSVNTGQRITTMTGGSPVMAAQMPGQQVGGGIQVQPPPTQPVSDASGQMNLLGAQQQPGQWVGPQPIGAFQGNPQQIAAGIQNSQLVNGGTEADRQGAMQALNNQMQGEQPKLKAAPPPGVLPAIAGTVETVNKDWADTVAKAGVGTDMGLLGNLKKFAAGAVTGVESDRRAYISGLAGLLHMSAGEVAKTDTDLLAKNTNMLALAGGDTNLARTMAEGANPNTHMTKEAITDAANQVYAQKKLALNKMEVLGPIKNAVDKGLIGPEAYNSALTKIQSIDPRVFQLSEMTKEEKAKMMNAMTPQQQDDFINMTRTAHALGFKP